MIENEQQNQPDEVPSEEQLDVEGPNESAQPSGAPGLDEGGEEPQGNPSDPSDST
ncbi:MAG TPA: hypothetical protein VF712_13225 [Thermoleophilaceae bacterium]|jgi:hypothetical protein